MRELKRNKNEIVDEMQKTRVDFLLFFFLRSFLNPSPVFYSKVERLLLLTRLLCRRAHSRRKYVNGRFTATYHKQQPLNQNESIYILQSIQVKIELHEFHKFTAQYFD